MKIYTKYSKGYARMGKKYFYYIRELFAMVLLMTKPLIPARKLKILSIYFHDPPPELLEKLIVYLKAKDYRIVSLSAFNDIIDKKESNEKVAILTLDDGWRNNKKLVEVTRKYEAPITIFVTTAPVDEGNFWFELVGKTNAPSVSSVKQEKLRLFKLAEDEFNSEVGKLRSNVTLQRSTLTREEVIGLSKEPFVDIASHTLTHPPLLSLSAASQKRELTDSKNYLENLIREEVNYFSYPFGYYSEQVKLIAKEAGYSLCFTTETNHIELNKIDKLSIPRRCVNDDAGYYQALSKIFGIWFKVKK